MFDHHLMGLYQLRKAAEDIAFCMNTDTNLGLSPTREKLWSALTLHELEINDNFDTILACLCTFLEGKVITKPML